MLEIAYEIMKEKKQSIPYMDLLKQVAELKGMSEQELQNRIAYLYTDLNIDGRFVSLADGSWGLRTWYPLDQIEEELIQTQKTSARKRKEDLYDDEDEDLLDEDYDDYDDEYEDLEDELDDITNEDEEDTDADDFDDEDEIDDFDDDEELSDEDNDDDLL